MFLEKETGDANTQQQRKKKSIDGVNVMGTVASSVSEKEKISSKTGGGVAARSVRSRSAGGGMDINVKRLKAMEPALL